MRRLFAVSIFVSFFTYMSGCSVGPDYATPEMDLPGQWHQAAESGLAEGAADVETWWQVFDDPQLASLVERAVQGNLDVRMAVLRIRQARALRGVAAGELLPTFGGSGAYQRSKASANGPMGGGISVPGRGEQFAGTVGRGAMTGILSQGISSTVPAAGVLASPLASGLVGLVPDDPGLASSPETNLWSSGFDASWELDVFGGIQRNVESADAEVAAAVEDYHSVLVSLTAEVAATYIDVRTVQAEIETTEKNIDLQQNTLDLTQSRLKNMIGSELETSQAETNLATTHSQLPMLSAALSTSIYRLSVLVGQEPSALYEELIGTKPIPLPGKDTFVGVPVDLLRRRPDIRSAELHLASETAKIGVATADLYPRFTLSGTFGVESTSFDRILDSRSLTYGFGPSVRWNIFNGLRNLNRIAAQEAATHHAYVAYEQTILTALQDVESSMAYYKREQARRDALVVAVNSAQKTSTLAKKLYEEGLTDFQDVVDAERALVNLERQLVQSRGQVAVYLVSIFKALGGGWSPDVTAQKEYLSVPTALDDPFEYFWGLGKTELPWEKPTLAEKPEGQDPDQE